MKTKSGTFTFKKEKRQIISVQKLGNLNFGRKKNVERLKGCEEIQGEGGHLFTSLTFHISNGSIFLFVCFWLRDISCLYFYLSVRYFHSRYFCFAQSVENPKVIRWIRGSFEKAVLDFYEHFRKRENPNTYVLSLLITCFEKTLFFLNPQLRL